MNRDWNAELARIKATAEQNIKAYSDSIPHTQIVQCNDFILSYVIENYLGIIQEVCTISNTSGTPFNTSWIPEAFQKAIYEELGQFDHGAQGVYPNRGFYVQYSRRVKEK